MLTGDSFFHLSALGEPLDGLNLCGAGRVVCLIDPVGDVYACPFVIDRQFLAGNVRDPGGFAAVWRDSALFTSLREPQSAGACASCGSFDACRGGCMAAKFFTGLPARRARPRVRARARRGRTGGTGRRGRSRRWATPRSRRDGTPIPVPHARPLPLTGPRLRRVELANATWPQVEATGAATVLAVPLGSLEQHGPHLPLDTDTRIAGALATGWRARCASRDRGARSGVRGQWGARRLPGHASRRPRRPGRSPGRARSFGPRPRSPVWCSSTPTGATRRRSSRSNAAAAAEGDDVLVWRATTRAGTPTPGGRRRRCCWPSTPRRYGSTWPSPDCTEPIATLLPRLRAEGVRPVSSNGVLGDPTGACRRRGPDAARRPRDDDLVAAVCARAGRPRREPGRSRHGRRRGAWARRQSTSSWPPGWQVVAVDRCADDPDLDYALATKADLEGLADAPRRPRCARWSATCAAASDMRAAVDEAVTSFGGLQAAVAAAGVISGGPPLWEIPDAQWDVQFDVNVKGVRNLAAAAVPALLEAPAPRQGRVVAVSSTAGLLGLPSLSAYSASKHAVIGFDQLPGGRPRRHGHHRQRRLPGLDPGPHARCVGRRLRPAVDRRVRARTIWCSDCSSRPSRPH